MSHTNRIDLVRPDAPELAAFGDFPVGVRTIEAVNRGQIDVQRAEHGRPVPRYDRPLTLEVWYPAASSNQRGGTYRTLIRDGKTATVLSGRAVRDAVPEQSSAPYPVIVISHGYPGNRYLLSHFGENLASKGYVCVAIDHTDSLYEDQADIASTLVNRPLDQRFALDELERLATSDSSFLSGLADTSQSGLIGYSMGGYGAIISAGGGIAPDKATDREACPAGILTMHQAGTAKPDPRLKAVISIAPWGMEMDVWNAEGLAGIRIPVLLMAGSLDEVSGYDRGVKAIYDGAINTDRFLLTFNQAGHNVAAPYPAPKEAWPPSPHLDFAPFEHYADTVWDTVRMNNIAQHFATVFFGKFVNGQNQLAHYLEVSRKGEDGWPGFGENTDRGLMMERAGP